MGIDREPGDDEREAEALATSIRPCPHCGPMPAMPELVRSDVSRRWQVFCGPCGSSSGSSRDPRSAVESWNSRHVSGPELATTSPALTRLALLLGNSLSDLSPSSEPPRYGFRDDRTRLRAYELARDLVTLINSDRADARMVEEAIQDG